MPRQLVLTALFSTLALNVSAAEPEAKPVLSGSVTVAEAEESFENATAWVRIWEYDPFLADAAADLFADEKVTKITHAKGTATEIPISLGDVKKVRKDRKYYVTIFVYRDGKVGDVKQEIFILNGFNKIDPPAQISGTLKKLNR